MLQPAWPLCSHTCTFSFTLCPEGHTWSHGLTTLSVYPSLAPQTLCQPLFPTQPSPDLQGSLQHSECHSLCSPVWSLPDTSPPPGSSQSSPHTPNCPDNSPAVSGSNHCLSITVPSCPQSPCPRHTWEPA
jgi:hypothetical protein